MPPGGVTLPDGRFVPAGTRIGMAIYHIHYNETIFPEPRKFDPDRWMKPASEIEQQLKFMVAFSRGSRSCLGIKYVIGPPRPPTAVLGNLSTCDSVTPSFLPYANTY